MCIFNIGMVHRSLSGWWRQRRQQHWQKVRPELLRHAQCCSHTKMTLRTAAQMGLSSSSASFASSHDITAFMLTAYIHAHPTDVFTHRLRRHPAAVRLSRCSAQRPGCSSDDSGSQARSKTPRTTAAPPGPLPPRMWCCSKPASRTATSRCGRPTTGSYLSASIRAP